MITNARLITMTPWLRLFSGISRESKNRAGAKATCNMENVSNVSDWARVGKRLVEEMTAVLSAQHANYVNKITSSTAVCALISISIALFWYPSSNGDYWYHFYYILAGICFVSFSLTNSSDVSKACGLSIFIDGYRLLIKIFILCLALASIFYFLTAPNNKDVFELLVKEFIIPIFVFGTASCVQINAFLCMSIGVKEGVRTGLELTIRDHESAINNEGGVFHGVVVEGIEAENVDFEVAEVVYGDPVDVESPIYYNDNPISVSVIIAGLDAESLHFATIHSIGVAEPLFKVGIVSLFKIVSSTLVRALFLRSKVFPVAVLIDIQITYPLAPSVFIELEQNNRNR